MGILDAPAIGRSPLGEQLVQTMQQHALRPWLAALAARDTAAVNILMLGDSVTEGKGSSQVRKRFLSRFRDQIRSRFPTLGVVGGDGYVPARYIMSSPTGSGFTETGTAGGLNTNNGLGRRSVSLTDATTTETLVRRCTSFDVLFTRGVGTSFDVSIDGAAATTVSTTGAGSNAVTWNSGNLGPGTHTIKITNGVGQPVVEGVMLYDGDESAGIRLWDGAHDGYTVSDFGGSPLAGNANWQVAITSPVTPDLIVIALGLNDFGTFGVTAAAYQANLTTLISQLRSKMTHPEKCTIVLLPLYERGDATALSTKVDTWANFVSACYTIAAADSYGLVAVCDVNRRMPITSESNFMSLYSGDQIHPADKGHWIIGDALTGFLAQYASGDLYDVSLAQMGHIPADFAYINWSFDPAVCAGNVAGAAGTIYTTRIPIRRRTSITNVHVGIGVAGATLTNAFAALYQGGVRLGVTADQSTPWTSTGEKKMALVGGPFTVEPGFVEVAWWVGTATTMPQMARGSNTQLVNAGTSGKNLRNSSADTGLTTTGPATLGTRTALANALWAAVS